MDCPVGDFITDSAFSRYFFYDPTTFATDPRVVGSVTGSAPVEHLHKHFGLFTKEQFLMHGINTESRIFYKESMIFCNQVQMHISWHTFDQVLLLKAGTNFRKYYSKQKNASKAVTVYG